MVYLAGVRRMTGNKQEISFQKWVGTWLQRPWAHPTLGRALNAKASLSPASSRAKGRRAQRPVEWEEGRYAQEPLSDYSCARHISWYWSLTVILQVFRICGTEEICLMQCSLEETQKNPPCHDNLRKGYYTSTLPSAKMERRRLQTNKQKRYIANKAGMKT